MIGSSQTNLRDAGHLNQPRLGVLLMGLASLSFSTMGFCSKMLTGKMPPMEIAFVRAMFTAIAILPFMIAWRTPILGKRRHILFLRSALGFCSLNMTFYAVSHIKLSEASVLFNTSVLFVPLLSTMFLKERVSKNLLLLILAGFLGAAAVLKPSHDVANLPGLAALGAGMLSALVYVAIRELHGSNSFLTIIFNFSAISALLSAIIFGSSFILPPEGSLPLLIGVGIAGTFGQIFMTYSYKLAPASIVSPFMFLGPIFGLFWDTSVWGQAPDAVSLAGILVVIVSGIGIVRLRPS